MIHLWKQIQIYLVKDKVDNEVILRPRVISLGTNLRFLFAGNKCSRSANTERECQCGHESSARSQVGSTGGQRTIAAGLLLRAHHPRYEQGTA